ncbi:MAG: tetratricopeptide repeat protein [Terriglobales bacterium]
MKTLTVLALILILPGALLAQSEEAPPVASSKSPAELAIERAQKAIATNPKNQGAYNDLALAFARRARETSDTTSYTKAEEALAKSGALAPDSLETRKLHVWVLLGRHEFARARDEAEALNRRVPDDVLVYGLLADAHAELGNYDKAEEAVQWMLDLRPGNVPGLTRAAYLRELFGDVEGAIEMMAQAYQRTSQAEVEDQAWILTHVAHLELMRGNAEAADQILQQALGFFPDYHYALANLAKVRAAQKKYGEAAELLERRYRNAPHPENLFDLAEALELAGRKQEAGRAFAEFEQKARKEMEKWDNSNRELVFYYAGHAGNPAEALKVARLEAARRSDVNTLHALAWALYANGNYSEARTQMEKALAVGIRDARFFLHAGEIAWKQGDRTAAERYLRQAEALKSPEAAALLASLATSTSGQ